MKNPVRSLRKMNAVLLGSWVEFLLGNNVKVCVCDLSSNKFGFRFEAEGFFGGWVGDSFSIGPLMFSYLSSSCC